MMLAPVRVNKFSMSMNVDCTVRWIAVVIVLVSYTCRVANS